MRSSNPSPSPMMQKLLAMSSLLLLPSLVSSQDILERAFHPIHVTLFKTDATEPVSSFSEGTINGITNIVNTDFEHIQNYYLELAAYSPTGVRFAVEATSPIVRIDPVTDAKQYGVEIILQGGVDFQTGGGLQRPPRTQVTNVIIEMLEAVLFEGTTENWLDGWTFPVDSVAGGNEQTRTVYERTFPPTEAPVSAAPTNKPTEPPMDAPTKAPTTVSPTLPPILVPVPVPVTPQPEPNPVLNNPAPVPVVPQPNPTEPTTPPPAPTAPTGRSSGGAIGAVRAAEPSDAPVAVNVISITAGVCALALLIGFFAYKRRRSANGHAAVPTREAFAAPKPSTFPFDASGRNSGGTAAAADDADADADAILNDIRGGDRPSAQTAAAAPAAVRGISRREEKGDGYPSTRMLFGCSPAARNDLNDAEVTEFFTPTKAGSKGGRIGDGRVADVLDEEQGRSTTSTSTCMGSGGVRPRSCMRSGMVTAMNADGVESARSMEESMDEEEVMVQEEGMLRKMENCLPSCT